MRKFIIVLLVMVSGLTHAQIMLPSYQAVQYRGPSVPVLTTTAASSITNNGANSGGNITLQGASAVTVRGVCWSISQNPVIGSGNQTSDGTGTGAFASSTTGLSGSTSYYLRAYATNNAGTGYGNQITFTTLATPPSNLGDTRDGGTVVYILNSGDAGFDENVQHGLIAVVLGGSTSYAWSNPTQNVVGTSSDSGTGSANTTAIYNAIGTSQTSYAARLCYDLVLGGKDDWYLPSTGDLITILPGSTYFPSGDTVTTGTFWSSTLASSTTANGVAFRRGTTGTNSQDQLLRVMAVRSY